MTPNDNAPDAVDQEDLHEEACEVRRESLILFPEHIQKKRFEIHMNCAHVHVHERGRGKRMIIHVRHT